MMKKLSVIAILALFICLNYVPIATVNAEVALSEVGEFTYLSNLQAYRVTFDDGVKYNYTEMKMGNILYHEGIVNAGIKLSNYSGINLSIST
jgi:hypothetical protein